jgi:hypothetical protein
VDPEADTPEAIAIEIEILFLQRKASAAPGKN